MKLSELMILGSTLVKHVPYSGNPLITREGCALQIADYAAGMGNLRYSHSWAYGSNQTTCPACQESMLNVAYAVVHLNDCHKWSIDKIAQWVASAEPASTSETTQARGQKSCSVEVA
jgi:hypothetical protein